MSGLCGVAVWLSTVVGGPGGDMRSGASSGSGSGRGAALLDVVIFGSQNPGEVCFGVLGPEALGHNGVRVLTPLAHGCPGGRVDEGVGKKPPRCGKTGFCTQWPSGRAQRSAMSRRTAPQSLCAPGVVVHNCMLQPNAQLWRWARPSTVRRTAAHTALRRLRSAAGAGGAAFSPA